MNKRPVQFFTALILCVGLAVSAVSVASAQPTPASSSKAEQEKEGCVRNLKTIYAAIQAYQNDHKTLPNWLSDLIPQYLPDTNVLVCPVCRRTGQIEKPPLGDPKFPSSYLFEFCTAPLGGEAPGEPNRTRREWKRLQMGMVGSIVPIVRCRQHKPVLNVAFDGKIYESPGMWEALLTNRVDPADLKPERMFAAASAEGPNAAARTGAARRFPQRDPQASPALLDLTAFYNARLNQSWHGGASNTLAALPIGVQTFAGVDFDVRGIVQLRSQSPSSTNFPASINGIPVHQKCERLYFLHAAGFGTLGDEGKRLGSYVVHFANDPVRMEIPIRYGREVRNWHTLAGEQPAPEELKEAWRGQNAVSKRAGHFIRLFLTTWTNMTPDLEIASIDYVSNKERPAPFLVAITAAVHHEAIARQAPASAAAAPEAAHALANRSETQPGRAVELVALIMLGIAVLVLGGALVALVWFLGRRARPPRSTGPKLLPPAEDGNAGTPSSFTVVLETQSVTGPIVPTSGPAAKPPPTLHFEAPGATHTEAAILRQRAEAAEEQASRARAALRRGLVAELGRWLKQKLLRRLITDRAELMAGQHAAATRAISVEERLAKVERQIQQQNDGYQRRIEQLTQELLEAKEENRELIRAQIRQVKAEMEAARARLLAQANEDERQ